MYRFSILCFKIFFICFIISSCGVGKFKLSKGEVESIGCDNFYLFSKEYKVNIAKADILEKWQKAGFTVIDTTFRGRKWSAPMSKIMSKCDTIDFINFQIHDRRNKTVIYFHGICLKNEKQVKKSQTDLKNLGKKIENEYLQSIINQ